MTATLPAISDEPMSPRIVTTFGQTRGDSGRVIKPAALRLGAEPGNPEGHVDAAQSGCLVHAAADADRPIPGGS